jgi:LAO/AO transport system kinase
MPILANDPNAYIRPTPSGSLLGGVARRSREVIALCEAAGFDTVLVETVGVGQSETEVANMTDCYLLLLQPASGDTLQGIKRGIMELADIVVVNKADGTLLPEARNSASHYMRALSLMPDKMSDWQCPVLLCSSVEKTGLDTLQQKIDEFLHIAHQNGHFQARRARQLNHWLEDETIASLIDRFKQDPAIQAQFSELNTALEAGQSPAALAAEFAGNILKASS